MDIAQILPKIRVSNSAPLFEYTENDQTFPAGMWRWRLQDDEMLLERALAADWGSDRDTLKIESDGTLTIAGGFNLLDDKLLTLGTNNDQVFLNRAATTSANELITNVIEGTSVHPATAANTLIISNITDDGDILILASDGGDSLAALFFDASAPNLYLYNVGGTWTGGATTWTIPAVTLGDTLALNGQAFDAGSDNFIVNTTGALRGLYLKTTQDGSGGVRIYAEHVSASPAVNDVIFRINAAGRDLGANIVSYGLIDIKIEDATGGAADGKLSISLLSNNSLTERLTLSGAGALWTDYSVDTLSLMLREQANAIADVAGSGQHWVKDDTPNNPYFTDDTGVDRQLVTADYAGIAVDGNTGATTIDIRYEWTLLEMWDADLPEVISNGDNTNNNITIGATGVYEVSFDMSAAGGGSNITFEITAFELTTVTGPIASTTTGDPVVCTDVGHPFETNDLIKITGVATADELNDKIYSVTKLTADTYSLQEDHGGDINGGAFGAGTGGTATKVNRLSYVHSHRKWAANDVGSVSGGAFVSLTKDNTIELYIHNETGTTNPVVEYATFKIRRVG